MVVGGREFADRHGRVRCVPSAANTKAVCVVFATSVTVVVLHQRLEERARFSFPWLFGFHAEPPLALGRSSEGSSIQVPDEAKVSELGQTRKDPPNERILLAGLPAGVPLLLGPGGSASGGSPGWCRRDNSPRDQAPEQTVCSCAVQTDNAVLAWLYRDRDASVVRHGDSRWALVLHNYRGHDDFPGFMFDLSNLDRHGSLSRTGGGPV